MTSNALPYEFVTSEKITIDYLRRSKRVRLVFPKHFKDTNIVRKSRVGRQKIVDKLLDYNRKLKAPRQVIQNIESLLRPETHAVITGQQPGLFSGPLYTIYKAMSTIVICERLSDQTYTFIPIFWNASEDHDLSEVNHITVFKQNEPFKIQYSCESRGIAFSHMSLDKSELKRMLTIVENVCPNTEFKASLLQDVGAAIQGSSTIGDFFSRFMIYLFGELGLVMIEPQYLRDLMIPVFDKLIRRPTECTRILNEAGSRLNRLGYSPKIHKKSNVCNFFILDDEGARHRVTYNGEFRVGSDGYTQGELLRLLDDEPSRFSANAITRSVTQDSLFPTFAYAAGPNEIAYQAQLKEVYDFFDLEMPVVFPRFGATILERKVSKVLRKYDAEIHELRKPENLMKRVAKGKIDDVFNSFRSEVLRGMDDVTKEVESIDETLLRSCSLARGKLLKTIGVLEDKILSKLKEHDVITKRQITKAYNNLFPYGDLQERQINILDYLIKFGKGFLKIVYENYLKADYGEHRVITC
ncbi:MAG: bacillithiol biosynthesis cysteine-adding enzyme BshC [Candidatus Bathyarchaeota archaeon]|nr:bacillithiol biosynthesis cysteine-adding enzyme BshC [Candidatus Bathyarchaeota archaeon]MDH5732362.1 bacillithiol biosynthesis cysteine-adding enzyme BshC [Candidatus Bathyarchaeota archaeon]